MRTHLNAHVHVLFSRGALAEMAASLGPRKPSALQAIQRILQALPQHRRDAALGWLRRCCSAGASSSGSGCRT